MKLIVEITTKDDRMQKHECNDFPNINPDFTILYKDGFRRELIATQGIAAINYYFKR